MSETPPMQSRARMARHTIWNLAGMCAPMAVALFAIPLLIRGLGQERFGLLSLVWMIVGYFGVFDLGLGRALTKVIAEKLGRDDPRAIAATFWTAMGLMLALGVLGALVVYGAAPWLAGRALNIDPALQPETLRAFRAVAFGLPVLVTVTGLIGTLDACHRFPLINLIRVPMGAFTFAGPLFVLPFSRDLHAVVLVLLAGRVAEWLLFFVACLRAAPGLRARPAFLAREAPGLLRYGGWMTVSNIVQPLMIHMDRFLIGAIRTVGDVAFYVTSAEIVVKLLILPRAWVAVLFPAFAAHHRDRPDATGALFAQSVRLLMVALFPIVLAMAAFAPEGLTLWLGPEFGLRSAPVMRWLAAGVFLFSLAYIPTSLLQGVGRPDLTAKWHLLEVPLYLAAAYGMIGRYGITGAAAAWLLRAALDLAGVSVLAARRAPGSAASLARIGLSAAVALALLAAAAAPESFAGRAALAPGLGLAFAGLCWGWLFTGDDRRIARKLAARFIPFIRAVDSGPATR